MLFAAVVSLILVQVAARQIGFPAYSRMEEAVRNPTTVLAIPSASTRATPMPGYVSSSTTYWIVDVQYSGVTCDSTIIMEHGMATGYCLETSTTSSVMYECSSATACEVHFYNDAMCETENINSPQPFVLGECQASDATDDGYLADDGENNFAFQQTIARQGYPTMFSGSSGIVSRYGTTTCDKNSFFYYQAFYQNRCYDNYDGLDYTSQKLTGGYSYQYAQIDCVNTNIDGKYVVTTNACEIDSATTSTMTTVSGDGNSKDNTGLIVGAVVGTIGGLALIAGLVFFFFFMCKAKQPMGQQAEMGNKV